MQITGANSGFHKYASAIIESILSNIKPIEKSVLQVITLIKTTLKKFKYDHFI